MNQTNCFNCGAAIDWDIHKCPYCGTQYVDFTNIDFVNKTPIVIRMIYPYNGHKCIIEQTAIPQIATIQMQSDSCVAYGANCQPLMQFTTSQEMTTDISFKTVLSQKNELYKIYVLEN